ncbi:MAG: hypothetical protein H6742_19835 [Alphaproteobacteria bacterium]|nr:hypothetical protein [Alphaproteobacteria bacterium]
MLAAMWFIGVALADVEIVSVDATPATCTPDAELTLTVEVASDGDEPSFAWTPDAGLASQGEGAIEPASDAVATMQCPSCPPGEDGDVYTVLVQVADPAGQAAFASVEIPMDCALPDDPKGCSVAPGAGALGGLWLAALGWVRRRSTPRSPTPPPPRPGRSARQAAR